MGAFVILSKAQFVKINSREMFGKNSGKLIPAKISSLKVIEIRIWGGGRYPVHSRRKTPVNKLFVLKMPQNGLICPTQESFPLSCPALSFYALPLEVMASGGMETSLLQDFFVKKLSNSIHMIFLPCQ